MTRLRLCLALCLGLLATLPARAQDGTFVSYDAMRAAMDGLLMSRQIAQVMITFGGADEMTPQQLQNLEAQVRQIYTQDLTNKAVLRRVDHGNGFHQEIVAYWTGTNYLYAYVFGHDAETGYVSINFRFNSDFVKLNQLF